MISEEETDFLKMREKTKGVSRLFGQVQQRERKENEHKAICLTD